ncbi:SET domain-containing protein 5 [Pseudocercospora fuligena]|uniref:SET domain-containing protein 5 n=1 Tax=Pseudocercospora fuligena TaxID=685502 RepID=A0A8H6RDY3_9PEZI|nr:SET domain-containing protein 5 [Pseudocercospora fuligena]
MFSITDTTGKGKGAIPLQDIPTGTLLQREQPIITIPRYGIQRQWADSGLPQLQGLSAIQKRQFFDLNNNFKEMRPIEGIVRTNAIPLGQSSSTGGIFPVCSRFNHSCTANAAYHWNPHSEEEKVYSVQDIRAGEEITVNYISDEVWHLPGKERRAAIKAKFGFDCQCDRCANEHELESDRRRKRLGDINRAVGGGQLIITNPAKALALCREAVQLLKEEGEGAPLLEQVYYDAFQVCVCHGDLPRAKAFAALSLEAKKGWQGDDAPELVEMEALHRRPESHRLAFHTREWASSNAIKAARLQEATPEWLWRRAG